ncbi:DNA repair protein RecN [Lysobacter sp. GX 14042]|uniref:DNA repair protein RecN n=1 Tax=Lysobacter sp. GX 14042 TaxID=2907155 RepID=UPI001F223586|nr:DNA repair protein RecN [Lysobacter sp. GX 14042]MCE7031310.1 DNA repair protein RecN [Lysobacter sp. GX 14042]
MLTHLSIKQFAVVTDAELALGPGLTVISGETGAGKSLLVDALSLLSGQRADSSVVRHGAERAELAGEFELAGVPAAASWLAAQELDNADEPGRCLLRRVIRADGGSRAWINGRPATLAQLSALASLLVEIHGQHEQQALLARPSQLALVDAFGRTAAERGAVAAAAAAWDALLEERKALLERGDVSDRIDWLQHQFDELEAEDLEPESIARLLADHTRQAHAGDLVAACEAALASLSGTDGSALADAIHQVRSALQKVGEHEPRLGEVDGMLEAAAIQLDEASALLDRIGGDLELEPEHLQGLERRLGRLHELGRKHRVPPEGLLAQRTRIAAELDALRGADERLQVLDREIESARDHWREVAGVLGRKRREAAAALSTAATALIGELGMEGGRFEIQVEPLEGDRPDPQGAERVEFLVAANPGQPARPLRKVASGGELSRVSLAIEVAAQGLDAVPTMIFDEVDSGIGGAVADIVGRRLRSLAGSRQVLCVTHLPQVAAQGHGHYRVSKAAHDGVTRSQVQRLGGAERAEELARMVGGAGLTEEALAAARRLLADVGPA